jgi:hypothetical protein
MKRTANPIDKLMCDRPVRIEYDSASHVGIIHMPQYCCTDMEGAISLFTAIDPEVEEIETYAAGIKDTFYRRDLGEWIAIPAK